MEAMKYSSSNPDISNVIGENLPFSLPQTISSSLTRLVFRLTPSQGLPEGFQASYKRGPSPVYHNSNDFLQDTNNYADWSSLSLDFSEFLNQDFTQQDALPTCDTAVSEPGLQLDFGALLASTTTATSLDFSTATTTTAASSTFTPVDISTRSDNASFDLIPAPATSFEPSPPALSGTSTGSEYASTGCSPSNGAMRVGIPTNSSWATFTGPHADSGNITPPPSVTNVGPHSKSSSPASAAAAAAKPSPIISDTLPEETGDSRKRKRERNTEAARRYRQRRQDRLEELEEALAAMTKDRDDLRIKLARSEAETDVLKGLMAKK